MLRINSMQRNWLDDITPVPTVLSSGFPEHMVLLDCETTGGKAIYHRIIEIGLLVIENGVLTEKWQSFIDPQVPLPPFIQRLTGINPSMLQGAPIFADIAEVLLSKLQGRTLVAHNARFDYSFLKNEFARAGISYSAKPLCSVKFSRNLYPQFKRHGLSQIIQRFDLPIENRHRALDDAEMIYRFMQKSTALFADDEIAATCKTILKRPSLPVLLDPKEIDRLPQSAGVYYFYDAQGALLYVGKSVHIRNRVLSHFSGDHKNPKDLQMGTKIAHIDFDQTPTDFGAQIHESNQIKAMAPLYNRRLRRVKKMYQYRSAHDHNGYLRISIEGVDSNNDAVDEQFGLFRSPRQASVKLQALADQYSLCHQLLGLESANNGTKPCFRSQLKKCFGACLGAEPAEIYNGRLQAALNNYQIKLWPHVGPILVEERDPQQPDSVAFHLLDQWRYISKIAAMDELYDLGYQLGERRPIPQLSEIQATGRGVDQYFDLDIYFILVRFLVDAEKIALNNLKIWPLTCSSDY